MFALPLAGPISRFLAWILDACCIGVVSNILSRFLSVIQVLSPDLSGAVNILMFFIVSIAYSMVLEGAWQGQTIGKRIFGLRVMDIQGMRLQSSQIIIRNLLRAVDSLPLSYMIGGVVCLLSRYGQRLGDHAANTILVKENKVAEPNLDQILDKRVYNSLHAYPHLEARLRQQINPAEAAVALETLMRRDELDPEARVRLFHEIASYLKQKVVFPDEGVYGVSDEQYVRNVVELVFQAQKSET
jgi:uncharacterized RDD family membrane protein YckC